MNLNTITRKFLLLARSLHLKSLSRTVAKAQQDSQAKRKARQIASSALAAANAAEDAALEQEARVRHAVSVERCELGLN